MNKSKKNTSTPLTVIDFFCGAGGFSEGFRQQGFTIIKGIDYWQPAIETHNLNHNLSDSTKNVLDFWGCDSSDIAEISELEDSSIIIGSPSCVSFSSSNKSGKAEKSMGIRLIESYLRVIAVKKHQPNSKLICWYMENVPNSKKYVREEYSFADLNLSDWAKKIGKQPSDLALKVKSNGDIFNAADFGSPQNRKRFIAGELCSTGDFIKPKNIISKHITLQEIKDKMPKPILTKKDLENIKFIDPNYGDFFINSFELTDHFYDTGVYKIEWEKAEYLKTNHPYMGKMSFPENEIKPSRTIMATRSASTREAIIYKSENIRSGDGEYRLSTIREVATLMGFPYAYQFVGSEGTKWRQIGNAVCPHLSGALASSVRRELGLSDIDIIDFESLRNNYKTVNNLNTFELKSFATPRKRNANARFRRHVIKRGNMTVDLLNYSVNDSEEIGKNWYLNVFLGTGIDHKRIEIHAGHLADLTNLLKDELVELNNFIKNHLCHFHIKKGSRPEEN